MILNVHLFIFLNTPLNTDNEMLGKTVTKQNKMTYING